MSKDALETLRSTGIVVNFQIFLNILSKEKLGKHLVSNAVTSPHLGSQSYCVYCKLSPIYTAAEKRMGHQEKRGEPP